MGEKVCKTCGVTKPLDSFSWTGPKDRRSRRNHCKKCVYEHYHKQYVAKNRDKARSAVRKSMAKRRAKDGDALLAYRREWYAKNIEKQREYCRNKARARRLADPDGVREYNLQWRRSNPDKQKAIEKRSYANNKARCLQFARNRKILKRSVIGSHTKAEWVSCVEHYGNKCQHCGVSGLENKMTRDHIIPLTRDGSDYISNIQPLCQSCNSRKGNRLESELKYLNKAA